MSNYMLEEFRVICAWCQSEIRAPRHQTSEKAPESHGVCRPCAIGMGAPPELFGCESED